MKNVRIGVEGRKRLFQAGGDHKQRLATQLSPVFGLEDISEARAFCDFKFPLIMPRRDDN